MYKLRMPLEVQFMASNGTTRMAQDPVTLEANTPVAYDKTVGGDVLFKVMDGDHTGSFFLLAVNAVYNILEATD
jgi:hypothetical protein